VPVTYEEIEPGQRVRIVVPMQKFRVLGTVKAKEIVKTGGHDVERVYVDDDRGGRRLCAPSVLTKVGP